MRRDMAQWLSGLHTSLDKKAFPILSFPCAQLLGISVRDLISDDEAQARGMKLVAERTNAIASVSLMDLSVEAECFGAQVRVFEDEVPTIVGALVEDEEGARRLEVPAVGSARSGLCISAIEKAIEMIDDRPVFAGVIGPFSLTARLFDVNEAMCACYDDPDAVHIVLEKATEFLIAYCEAFKRAGANGVLVAEPVAGLLSPEFCEEFSCRYMSRIVEAVQDDSFLVIYHNCGNTALMALDRITAMGCAAYHFGNAVDMADVLENVASDVVVMGNVDPVSQFRNGTPESMRQAVSDLLDRCGSHSNFIISSGCDIPPSSNWDAIDAFFEAVGEYYAGRG